MGLSETVDPSDPGPKLNVTHQPPPRPTRGGWQSMSRNNTYRARPAPFIVGADGIDRALFTRVWTI